MAALGMPPGRHLLGDYEVTVDATSGRLADGTLAGSILSLDQALRNLVTHAGCTLAEALPTITTTPANVLGLEAERGRMRPVPSPTWCCCRPTCACTRRSPPGTRCTGGRTASTGSSRGSGSTPHA